MARDGRNKGAFVAICLDFKKHLMAHREQLEEFLEFYSFWAPMRKNTIATLEDLCKVADRQEASSNDIRVKSKSVAVAGNLVFAAGTVFCPPLAVGGKVLAAIGHGVASGASAAEVHVVAGLRKKAKRILEEDLVERQGLVELGLKYNAIVEKVEKTIKELAGVSLVDLMKEVKGVLGFEALLQNLNQVQSGNVPRDAVNALMTFFTSNSGKIEGASEIGRLLTSYMKMNSKAADCVFSFIEFAFDVSSICTMLNEGGIDGFLGGGLSQVANIYFIYQDCKEISEINAKIGQGSKSVTAEEIEQVLGSLKREAELMEKNYVALRRFHSG